MHQLPATIRCLWSLLTLLCLSVDVYGNTSAAKPNIVLIFVDDMGYGDPGCYGGSLVPTPNIDSLTEPGIRFTQGYSVSPVCGPSRVGLLSGMQPSRIGVYWNPDMGAVKMPKGHQVLPQALKAAGYTTGLVGKWNLNNPGWDPMPAGDYFDQTYDVMVWEGDYWPNENGAYKGVDDRNYGSSKQSGIWGPAEAGDEYLTDRLTRHACEFIREQKDNPFFLMLAYNAPHSPLQGKREHQEKLLHIESDALQLYASMVLAIDDGVGQMLGALNESQITENTMVLFISDNGPATTRFKGMPEAWPRGELLGSTAGLRGHKGTYYEGGIRVPFIIQWPSTIPQAITCEQAVTTLDLLPTLCAVAGAKPDQQMYVDGHDITPTFSPENPALAERTLLWMSDQAGAVRQGDWKLVYDADDGEQLFNLGKDPAESQDRWQQEPEIARRLKATLGQLQAEVPPPITPRKSR